MNKDFSKLYQKAEEIAGAILEDDDATEEDKLSERIERAANWSNMGTDGDLTAADRKELRRLAKLAAQLEAADQECARTLEARDETPEGPGYSLAALNHAAAAERYFDLLRSV